MSRQLTERISQKHVLSSLQNPTIGSLLRSDTVQCKIVASLTGLDFEKYFMMDQKNVLSVLEFKKLESFCDNYYKSHHHYRDHAYE